MTMDTANAVSVVILAITIGVTVVIAAWRLFR